MNFTAVLKDENDLVIKDFTLSNEEYEAISAVVDFIKKLDFGEVTVRKSGGLLETVSSIKVKDDPFDIFTKFMQLTQYGEFRIKKHQKNHDITIFNRSRFSE